MKLFEKYRKLIGFLLLVIVIFLLYYRFDIIIELVDGRPLHELELYRLILPIVLGGIVIFLFTKNMKKNDSKNHN